MAPFATTRKVPRARGKAAQLPLALAMAMFALVGGHARAACTVPNPLTNGQTADASQVMANLNAVAGCVNSLAAGSTNSVQINAGSGLLGAVGPLTNGQVIIGSSGNAPVAASLTAGSGVTITNGPGSITIAASGAFGAGVGAPQGRLTLTSGSPVMSADVVAATTVYYDCYAGKSVPYFTGATDAAASISGCETSTALQSSGSGVVNGGDVFDVFWAQGASTICVATSGSGGGWSSDTGGSTTARGTGYSQVHNSRGYWTNANSLTHCYNGATDEGPIGADQATYLGSFFTTAAGATAMQFNPAAAAGGSNNFLGLWNAYNRVQISTTMMDSDGNWSVPATISKVDNSADARVTAVDGLGQSQILANIQFKCASASGSYMGLYINQDNVSAGAPDNNAGNSVTSGVPTSAMFNFAPKIGLHYLQGMSYGGATGGVCYMAAGAIVASLPM